MLTPPAAVVGIIKLDAPPELPVRLSRKCLTGCVPLSETAKLSVKSEAVTAIVVVPTIASSSAVPKLTLVVVPQVPDCSPVPISSTAKFEYVDIFNPYPM